MAPRVVCLSGSTRFREQFERIAAQLTLEGCIVLMPHVWVRSPIGEQVADVTEEQKLNLDELHLHKIDMAEEVIVINPGYYIGASTAQEIAYAERKGKLISYSSGTQDETERQEEELVAGGSAYGLYE